MNEISTVSIDKKCSKILDRLAKRSGVSKKEFVALSLAYFEKHGINPIEYESPSIEMERIRKRIEQMIAFIRTQEKDKINPMFEAITKTEARLLFEIDNLVKVQNIKSLTDVWDVFVKDLQQKQSMDKELLNSVANGMYLIAQVLEGNKDKQGLSEKIKDLFSRK